MPLGRAYVKLQFRRPVILIQPGVKNRNSAGQFTTSDTVNHTGHYCNWRTRTANERLTGGVDISRNIGTALFRKTNIFNTLDSTWLVSIDGIEYNIIGQPEELQRGRLIRLTLERVG